MINMIEAPVETLEINDYRVERNSDFLDTKLFWVESNGKRIDVSIAMRPNKNMRLYLDHENNRIDQVVSGLYPFSVERSVEMLYDLLGGTIDKDRVYTTVWNIVKQTRDKAKWHFDSRGVYVGNEFGESRYVK